MSDLAKAIAIFVGVLFAIPAFIFLWGALLYPPFLIPFAVLALVVILLLYFGVSTEKQQTQVITPQPQTYYRPADTVVRPSPGTITMLASLRTTSGALLPVSSQLQMFGREDFENYIDRSTVGTISRRQTPQFTISFRGGRFYIEDRASANGTLLNKIDIRGTGPKVLNDSDVISPAGILTLVFKTGAA